MSFFIFCWSREVIKLLKVRPYFECYFHFSNTFLITTRDKLVIHQLNLCSWKYAPCQKRKKLFNEWVSLPKPIKRMHVIETCCHLWKSNDTFLSSTNIFTKTIAFFRNQSFWVDWGLSLTWIGKVALGIELNVIGGVKNTKRNKTSPNSFPPNRHTFRLLIWYDVVYSPDSDLATILSVIT